MDKLFINRVRFNERMEIPYGKFPCSLPSLKNLDIEINSPVTFIIGENGVGKSTLIEGIAVSYGFNPEGGSINYNFKNGRYTLEFRPISNIVEVYKGKMGIFS